MGAGLRALGRDLNRSPLELRAYERCKRFLVRYGRHSVVPSFVGSLGAGHEEMMGSGRANFQVVGLKANAEMTSQLGLGDDR